MGKKTPDPIKTIKLKPLAFYQVKILNKTENEKLVEISSEVVENKLLQTINVIKPLSNWIFTSVVRQENKDYFINVRNNINPYDNTRLPSHGSERSKKLGLDIDSNILPYEMINKSRVQRLIRGNVASLIDIYADKYHTINDDNYISSGKKRTFSWSYPKCGNFINFGYADSAYQKMTVDDNIVEFRFVAYDIKVAALFSIPDNYNIVDARYCAINVSYKDGHFTYNFPIQIPRLYPKISTDYVIGVDIGQKNAYIATVVRTSDGSIVDTVLPSKRVASINRDIRESSKQLTDIKKKYYNLQKWENNYQLKFILGKNTTNDNDYHYYVLEKLFIYEKEISDKRRSITRKKRELAILIGQEITNLSLDYSNAVIALEELSFVVNTTNNSRWNYGEMHYWIGHYCNLQGLLCYKVNAHNTSVKCSNCGSCNTHKLRRIIHCNDCSHELDRDVSASIIIARRVIDNAIKSSNTRNKKRKSKDIYEEANNSNGDFIVRIPVRRETNRPVKNRNKNTLTKKQDKSKNIKKRKLRNCSKEVNASNNNVSCIQRDMGSSDNTITLDSNMQTSFVYNNIDNDYNNLLSFYK